MLLKLLLRSSKLGHLSLVRRRNDTLVLLLLEHLLLLVLLFLQGLTDHVNVILGGRIVNKVNARLTRHFYRSLRLRLLHLLHLLLTIVGLSNLWRHRTLLVWHVLHVGVQAQSLGSGSQSSQLLLQLLLTLGKEHASELHLLKDTGVHFLGLVID
jgi:hypothetical protein